MGAISGLLGMGGGANGTGVAGPQNATLLNPATTQQATDQYGNAQTGLNNQQAFLQAVQAQNGLQNQSNVYNQLQGVANGTGPNPAQAQLAQATAANNANQASLMAGQRGASQNAGLIARQATMQGGANQQQAAGQAATMQANQSLGALNQMGGLASTQAQQQANATNAYSQAAQGEQGQILGAIGAQNNANVSNQASINAANAQMANTTAQGQQGMLGGLLGAAGTVVGSIYGGPAGGAVGGMAGKAIGGAMKAHGGMINMKDGGEPSSYLPIDPGQDPFAQSPQMSTPTIAPTPTTMAPQPSQEDMGPKSSIGKMLAAPSQQPQAASSASNYNYGNPGANQLAAGISGSLSPLMTKMFTPSAPQTFEQQVAQAPMAPATPQNDPSQAQYAQGGQVDAMLSPGERYLNPSEAKKVAEGKKDPMKAGVKVPGKPVVPGAKDDYANDIKPAKVEVGGIVIPRSITQGKNPESKEKAFVAAHFKQQALKKSK